ncbi:MAG: 30S ribosomal protein S18 [Parcubacteria group bacterium]|nr:30S ribosomal protein S18 [Parcubacteria group bacterium]
MTYSLPHDVTYIDYKDVEVLKKFLTPHGQIMNRRKSGLTAFQQRLMASAIKRARFMGLLPYVQK